MKRGLIEVKEDGEEYLQSCQYNPWHTNVSEFTWSADFRLRIPTAFNMTEDMSVEFASKVSVDIIKLMSMKFWPRELKLFSRTLQA